MGKLTYFVAQSVDGYIEGPNGEFDWPVMKAELSAYSRELTQGDPVFLYGRVVWEMMSAFWPKAEEYSDDPHDIAFAPIWRAADKIVVSRTLKSAEWNTRVVRDDVVGEIAKVKEAGRDLVMFGGSALASYLTAHGAIDEYLITVHPVLLGGGKPVFEKAADRTGLELVETRTFDGQVALLKYVPKAGA